MIEYLIVKMKCFDGTDRSNRHAIANCLRRLAAAIDAGRSPSAVRGVKGVPCASIEYQEAPDEN